MEYWITFRERGSHEESKEVTETHRSKQQAHSYIIVSTIFNPLCGQLSLSRPTRRWRLPKAPSPMSRRWRPVVMVRSLRQHKLEIAWRLDMLVKKVMEFINCNIVQFNNSIKIPFTCLQRAEPAELQAFLGFCAGKIDEASNP